MMNGIYIKLHFEVRVTRGMIIIKCDVCKKVIKPQHIDYWQIHSRQHYRVDEKGVKDICNNCKIHLSERFDKKYHKLQTAHDLLQKHYKQKVKECKAFKALKKEDIRKTARVVFD